MGTHEGTRMCHAETCEGTRMCHLARCEGTRICGSGRCEGTRVCHVGRWEGTHTPWDRQEEACVHRRSSCRHPPPNVPWGALGTAHEPAPCSMGAAACCRAVGLEPAQPRGDRDRAVTGCKRGRRAGMLVNGIAPASKSDKLQSRLQKGQGVIGEDVGKPLPRLWDVSTVLHQARRAAYTFLSLMQMLR